MSTPRPTDLVLLAVRALALLLIGAAFARPVRAPAAGAVARIFLVDRSRAVADPAEARDSVRRLGRAADVVVAFDSAAARPVPVGNARAWVCRSVVTSAGVSDGLSESISETMPATCGVAIEVPFSNAYAGWPSESSFTVESTPSG